jgi:serine/threonine protein kinase
MPQVRSRDTELILGYRLAERLGSGGFGEVWKAEAPGGLLKAIKFVYGELSDRHASREVKALERIKEVRHPFVLSLERVEVLDGRLLIVSELADKTLLDRFEECRAAGEKGIPRSELLAYLRDAAEALDFISTRFGLQHLDIKPSNLFLMGGRLKVGDFGLVREVCHQTDTSFGGLSPAYAAPESFTGAGSLFSDQYALAIVYQEMLTGKRPFAGRTLVQLAEQHQRARPNLAPLTEEEQLAVGRALSKNPGDRFPTCAEMVQDLLAVKVQPPPAAERQEAPAIVPQPLADSPPGDLFRPMDVGEANLDPPAGPTLPTCPSSESELGTGSTESGLTADPLDGLPEPTLFVGIGGIAGRVLRQIKSLFESRYELRQAGLPLGWLLLDTDRAALQEICRPDAAGALRADETLLIPLHGPDHYRPHVKELIGWLDRHWLYRIPRSNCTEGIRPLGRLALLDNAREVVTRLRQSIQEVSTSKTAASNPRLRIVVVAGIGGGTGGGCLADLGLAMRALLRGEQLEATSLDAVLILAASVRTEQQELARANAHVTLREFSYFLDPQRRIPGVGALGVVAVEGGEPIFDRMDLAEFGEIVGAEDIETACHLVAEYAYLNLGTPYGQALASRREATEGPAAKAQVRSFRLGRLSFPRAELRRLVAWEVCRRMIDRWLHGFPVPAAEEAMRASLLVTDSDATEAEPPGVEAERFFMRLDLEEGRFHELFLERMDRVSGSDLHKVFQRGSCELLQARSRKEADRVIARFFEEQDERFGPASDRERDVAPARRPEQGPGRSLTTSATTGRSLTTPATTEPAAAAATPFVQKLRNEFRYDSQDQEQQLDAWVRRTVEDPGRRLNPDAEALDHLRVKLAAEIEATRSRTREIRERAQGIRQRLLGGGAPTGARERVSSLLKSLQHELAPQADDLSRYGELRIQETALAVREEVLAALLAATSLAAEELARLHQGLEKLEHVFEPDPPRFRNSERGSLGFSIDLLPIEAPVAAEAGGALAGVFCSDRRLARLERRIQEEVLSAHGGFAVVIAREPAALTEFLKSMLFPRVAGAVDDWLEGQGAAKLLRHRHGSIEGAADELVRRWQSASPGNCYRAGERLVLATPGNPSGRSLRECLAKTAGGLEFADFVTVPDDVVICLELENINLQVVADDLVSGQPWLAGLAAKLVTRIDVDWPGLDPTRGGRETLPGT